MFPNSFRKGAKAEYLTQIYMSAIGFANPTQRQEDFGIDFTCMLSEKIKNNLYPIHPFTLQVKSHKKEVDQKIVFKKNSNQDLKWLFENPIPYFLVWVDEENTKTAYFYSLSPLWYIDIVETKFKKLEFIYDTKLNDGLNTNNYKPDMIIEDDQIINIGKPFMTFSLDDLKSDSKIEEKRNILQFMIELEKENIKMRSFKIPFMKWLWKVKTDDINSFKIGWSHFSSSEYFKSKANYKSIIKNNADLFISLAASYNLHIPDIDECSTKSEITKNKKMLKEYGVLGDFLKLITDDNQKKVMEDLQIMKNGKFYKNKIYHSNYHMLNPTGYTQTITQTITIGGVDINEYNDSLPDDDVENK